MPIFSINSLGYAEFRTQDKILILHSENSEDGALVLETVFMEELGNSILRGGFSTIKTKYFTFTIETSPETLTLSWPSESGEETISFNTLEFLKHFYPKKVREFILRE